MKLMEKSEKETIDYIGDKHIWNKAIDEHFDKFLEFFALDVFEKINFSKGYKVLKIELIGLVCDSEEGNIDRLVKVHLKNGSEKLILCYVEVEGYNKSDFEKRMFKYYYRILDKYDKDVFIVSILSKKHKNHIIDNYNYKFIDTQLNFRYRICNILEQDQDKLKESDNYFANLVLKLLQL